MRLLARQAAALLGETVAGVTPIHGGDLSDVLLLRLGSGQRVIAKGGPAPLVEGDMLRAITASGSVAPSVLAANDQVLVLQECDDSGALGGAAWADLGAMLKSLHGKAGTAYGWQTDYAFATLPIRNGWQDDWHQFWAANRLLAEADNLPAALTRRLQTLSSRLGDFIPKTPPARLLHGDLWTGNVLTGRSGQTTLIDPACYFGDPEVDLAMLSLFGSPAPEFWASYGTPAPGWPERCALYQLWPAIVHLRLFGSAYESLCNRLLKTLGC